MKKSVFTLLLLFTALGASAQFHADLRVGAAASTFGDEHLKMGFRGGVGLSYLFTKHWGLRTGLYYSNKGMTRSNNVFNYSSDKAARLSYLDLPVEAVARFGMSPRSAFEIHGGVYVACCVIDKMPSTVDYKARRIDTGVGAGFDFVVGHFIVGPEIQYGLTRLTTSGNNHNITYALTLGCRF
ncbi:MAG: PorT family protein [Alistipes sp.]|nr:PorT family protein [Alistipes sp.]